MLVRYLSGLAMQHACPRSRRELSRRSPYRYIGRMKQPTDPQETRPSYWVRGPKTRRHTYFYPSDDRAGFALMLLIAILGLVALGVGARNILVSPQPQPRDLILAGLGLIVAATGLYQANRLRRWN